MISVQVRLFATLRKYLPQASLGQPVEVEIPEGSTVLDLLAKLGVPAEEMKQTFVNGVWQEPAFVLNQGDEVGIFPPIGGG